MQRIGDQELSKEVKKFEAKTSFVRLTREPLLRGRLSTIDLLVKITCFVKKDKQFSIKSSSYKLVSTRRSTVLSLPLQ
jgi:hypothetical protein